MKHLRTALKTTLALMILSLVSSTVWATAQSAVEEIVPVAPESMPEGIVEPAADIAEAAAELEAEPAEPTGLDVVMDGSSMEAWNASMEEVKEVGGLKEQGQVQDAFDYLLMFDIGAKGKPELLAQRLDGMTGNEIISRVNYGKRRRQ